MFAKQCLLVVVDLSFQSLLILYLLCLELLHDLKALLYVGLQVLQQLHTTAKKSGRSCLNVFQS